MTSEHEQVLAERDALRIELAAVRARLDAIQEALVNGRPVEAHDRVDLTPTRPAVPIRGSGPRYEAVLVRQWGGMPFPGQENLSLLVQDCPLGHLAGWLLLLAEAARSMERARAKQEAPEGPQPVRITPEEWWKMCGGITP